MYRLCGIANSYHSVFDVNIEANDFNEAWEKSSSVLKIIDLSKSEKIELSLVKEEKND